MTLGTQPAARTEANRPAGPSFFFKRKLKCVQSRYAFREFENRRVLMNRSARDRMLRILGYTGAMSYLLDANGGIA
jgi:hypothetical protein